MAETPGLWVIIGPTASGKSALAFELARRLGGEILTVDSMQVYRGMDIGTAKPTPAEQAAVRHHLLDVVTPDETFAVARFVELADEAIADAARRGVPLIATGGTPLYYKALFEGIFEGPGADETIRSRLRALHPKKLYAKLQEVDPAAAERIHPNDERRLVRALEVYELTGKPITSFQTHWTDPAPRYIAKWVGLNWERDALNQRINARVRTMIAAGWVDEVRSLQATYPVLSRTALAATGYRELLSHVSGGRFIHGGNLTLDEVVEYIKIDTRQLARRQMKWFRRFPGVRWIAGDAPVEQLVEAVSEQ